MRIRDIIGKAKYSAIHRWITKRLGKATHCSFDISHTAKRFEWANISNEYKWDFDDYIQLCPSCHRKFDYTEDQRERRKDFMMGNTYAKRTKVVQIDKKGFLIRSYDSIADASRTNGILTESICNVLARRAKTAGGFIWSLKK